MSNYQYSHNMSKERALVQCLVHYWSQEYNSTIFRVLKQHHATDNLQEF